MMPSSVIPGLHSQDDRSRFSCRLEAKLRDLHALLTPSHAVKALQTMP